MGSSRWRLPRAARLHAAGLATAVSAELVAARSDFDIRFSSAMRAAFDALVAEHGDGVPEPGMRVHDVDDSGAPLAAPAESPYERAVREAAEKAAQVGAKRLREWLRKIAEEPGAAADVANWLSKSRVGRKVLDADGKLTKAVGSFKPWGKINAAQKIAATTGKVRWVMQTMSPLMDVSSIAQDQHRRMKVTKRRQALRDHFAEVALSRRNDLTEAGGRHLGAWIAEVEQSLSGLTRPGAEISAAREKALEVIGNLREEAENPAGV